MTEDDRVYYESVTPVVVIICVRRNGARTPAMVSRDQDLNAVFEAVPGTLRIEDTAGNVLWWLQ